MARGGSRKRRTAVDPWHENMLAGWETVSSHPIFRRMVGAYLYPADAQPPAQVWAYIDPSGAIRHQSGVRATPEEWAWVFAHLSLHAGFGHLDPRAVPARFLIETEGARQGRARRREPSPAYRAACCALVDQYLLTLKIGRPPLDLPAAPGGSEERALAERWEHGGVPEAHRRPGFPDFLVGDAETARKCDHPTHFAVGIGEAARAALAAAGRDVGPARAQTLRIWDRALAWFVSSYPLLGSLASGMRIVADAEVARGWNISIAAVNAEAAEIYINPFAVLTDEEWRFVLAHEMLHAALRHGERAGWRDHYLFNVACDYVVNGWLVEMGVGELPDGLLYDPELKGMSAEAVYDLIATDLRRMRRLATLRGRGQGDILDQPLPHGGKPGRYIDLDEYYRSALSNGLAFHLASGRGLLPAGLEQEIRALDQPPLPWDAQLARWFDEHVPAVEKRRTYARASRRQSATPDIPRPAWARPEESVRLPTFGVVLDTSGSMSTELMGKGLGAIAAYARARDVPYARVVFCDAAAHDAGYLPVDEIASRVRVRGRGGTVLQPGIRLLERAADFPADGPVLIITDGYCDVLRIRSEHAFLMPAGASLPFRPRGPVFRMR
ncbi:vWA domain-containing protein [Nocardia sp. NPDC055321]